MSDWKISRKGTACAVCNGGFKVGDAFVSAIFLAEPAAKAEGGPTFERMDACPGCFEKVERTPFSRWTTRLPPDADKQPLLDLGMARDFLVRLAREGNPERGGLMHVLTLLLLRKRKVKLVEQLVADEGPIMRVIVPAEEGDEEIIVPAEPPDEEETAELESEVARLFGLME